MSETRSSAPAASVESPAGEPQPQALFEILVREHQPRLRAFLSSMLRDSVAVDDIAQETFLVAWRNLSKYDRSLPFGPWLRGIGRRLCLAYFRKRRDQRLSFVEDDVVDELCGLHDALDRSEGDTLDDQLSSLRACLQRLPDHQRQVLELHYEKDLDCSAIASSTGKTREAVKKILQRSRAWLGQCIEQRLQATGGGA